jgi:hypothetical protein
VNIPFGLEVVQAHKDGCKLKSRNGNTLFSNYFPASSAETISVRGGGRVANIISTRLQNCKICKLSFLIEPIHYFEFSPSGLQPLNVRIFSVTAEYSNKIQYINGNSEEIHEFHEFNVNRSQIPQTRPQTIRT